MLKKFFLRAVVSSAIAIHHATLSSAFPLLRPVYTRPDVLRSSMTALYMRPDDITNDDHDFFDAEAARRQLESLVGSGAPAEQQQQHQFEEVPRRPIFASIAVDSTLLLPEPPKLDVTLPARSPLTTIERERRSAEIELLAHLDGGDEALPDIWNLWFTERGPQAAALLKKADDLISEGSFHSQGWKEAEEILCDLIEEYGVYFSEPVKCLALLYYLQGRMDEALSLNQTVLAVKPWHFGALSHIVMIYAALGDSVSAGRWAAFRLPEFSPVGSNRRRTRWVERAVVDATIFLHEGEQNLAKTFGESDKTWFEKQQGKIRSVENDADAWQ